MAEALIRPFTSTFTVTLKGLAADKKDMPVGDVVSTLSGWRDFLEISTSVLVNKQFELFEGGSEGTPCISIRRIRRGSWVAQLVIQLAGGVLLIEYAKHRRKFGRLLASWRKKLFAAHLEQKRSMHNVQQVAEAMKALAEEHEITCPDNVEAVVEALDDSLKLATAAIEHSAETIQIDDESVTTTITRLDKDHLHSGFLPAPTPTGFHRATVRFTELDIKTGHADVVVVSCDHPEFRHARSCRIRDRALKQARNAYLKAFDDQRPLAVWVKVNPKGPKRSAERWSIMQHQPRSQPALFD